jgi:hypothetical protein
LWTTSFSSRSEQLRKWKIVLLCGLAATSLQESVTGIALFVDSNNGFLNTPNNQNARTSASSLAVWSIPMFVLGLLTAAVFVLTLKRWDDMVTAERLLVVVPALPGLAILAGILLYVGIIVLACVVAAAVVAIALWIYFGANTWSGGAGTIRNRYGQYAGTVDAGGVVRDKWGAREGQADAEGVVRDWRGNPTGTKLTKD